MKECRVSIVRRKQSRQWPDAVFIQSQACLKIGVASDGLLLKNNLEKFTYPLQIHSAMTAARARIGRKMNRIVRKDWIKMLECHLVFMCCLFQKFGMAHHTLKILRIFITLERHIYSPIPKFTKLYFNGNDMDWQNLLSKVHQTSL